MTCCGQCIETTIQAFCDLEDRHEGLHETRVDGCLWQWNDEACKHYDWKNLMLPRDSDRPCPELINDIYYCAVDCPYLEGDPESVNKRCAFTGKELDFYDWHLASCVDGPEHA